jgi:hypothetical protein
MKRARVAAPIISALAIVLLSISLAGPARAAAARPASGPIQTVVLDCPGMSALVRPKTYILTCADGAVQLNKLSWTSWTPGLASATGTLVENTCSPTCVAGHFRTYSVLVVLWGTAAVKVRPGEHCYTRMTLIYPGSRPAGVGQTETVPLPTSLPVLVGA